MKKSILLILALSAISLMSCEHGYFAIEQAQDAERDERDADRDKEINERFDRLDEKLGIDKPEEEDNTRQAIVSRKEPTQFADDYYSLINNGQIDQAWDMLTPQFRGEVPSSYSEYAKWWNSVDEVQVKETNLISQDDNIAVIEVETSYVIGDSYRPERPLQLTLIWNDPSQHWKLLSRKKL